MIRYPSAALATCSVLILFFQTSAHAQDPNQETVIDALRVGLNQWLNDVEFVSSYVRTEGRAATLEGALKGEFAVQFSERETKGHFNKAFGKIRVSADIAAEPEIVSASGGIVNVDFDEVTDGEIQLTYWPIVHPNEPHGSAIFKPRNASAGSHQQNLGRYDAGDCSWRTLSPITIAGWEIGCYLVAPEGAENVTESVLESNADRVSVQLEFTHLNYHAQRRVDVLVGSAVPVIEKVSYVQEYSSGQRYESYAQAFDFVECPGGLVPRVVRSVHKNDHPDYPDLPFDVREWRSDDLGDRLPTHGDFVVPIHDRTRIDNLHNDAVALVDGGLDIARVSLQDLGPRRNDPGALAVEEARRSFPSVLVWGNVALVVIIAMMFFLRRLLRRRGQSSAAGGE